MAVVPHFVEAARGVRKMVIDLAGKHSAPLPRAFEQAKGFRSKLERLAQQPATAVSLSDLYRFGLDPSPEQNVRNSAFMHYELPIRFAQRVADLRALPFDLSEHPDIEASIAFYENTVYQLSSVPKPTSALEEQAYACLAASVLMDHRRIPMAISNAIHELHRTRSLDPSEQRLLDRRLDDFFMARISMRFLIEHYIASHRCAPGFSGVIAKECRPTEVVSQAKRDVAAMAYAQLGTCPQIEVLGENACHFRYVPSHLYFVTSELLKNSVRATVEAHPEKRGQALPPVRAIVVCGGEDDQFESMSMKIEDQGGGIRRSEISKAFSYSYSTAQEPDSFSFPNATASLSRAGDMTSSAEDPLAGLGLGLPLSRLYSRYFGGSLDITSMEKYGTDAYVSLPHFGDDLEILPKPVLLSPSQVGSCPKGKSYTA